MGLLDLFSSKKKREEQEMLEALRSIFQAQAQMCKGGVDTDDLPTGYGPFGLAPTNPVPAASIFGSKSYLARLRTKEGRAVQAERRGSTSAPDVTQGMIDIYELSVDDQRVAKIFICPYHRKTSQKAPEGFVLV